MRPLCALTLAVLLLPGAAAGSAAVPLAEAPGVAAATRLLDLWVEEQMAHQDLPAVVIGVVHDQEVVWARGWGLADRERRIAATPQTLFRVGSVTKLFTATAVLQLRDAGKLRLDDPVARHLPWFRVESDFLHDGPITIRQLLTHTSGLPREAAFAYWTEHVFPSRGELRAALPGQRAVFAPASRYKYSNLGLSLAGEVVAAVSGMPWADYLERHVFAPLGMTGTTGAPGEEHLSRRAVSYMRRLADGTRPVFDYYDTGAIAPAANVLSSVEDLLRFARLQFRTGPAGGEQIVSGATLREMHRPHWVYDSWTGGRGLGFGISRRDGKTIVSHGGWIGGNRTHFLLVPGEKVGVVAFTNADDGSPASFGYEAYDLLGPAIRAAVARAAEPAAPRQADPSWQAYVGTYTDPWHWEYRVLVLDDELVLYEHNYPPEEDAEDSLTRLEPVAEHTFRMSDGELVVFEMDEEGRVERIRRRYEYLLPKP